MHAPGDVVEVCDCEIRLIEQDYPEYPTDIVDDRMSLLSTERMPSINSHKDYLFIDFIRMPIYLFSTLYTHSQSMGIREDWGHSSNIMGVELPPAERLKPLPSFTMTLDPVMRISKISSLTPKSF